MKSISKLLLAILLLVGTILASLSLLHDVGVQRNVLMEPSFCSVGSLFDCEKVAASPYAQLFGYPLSLFALLFYGLFFLLTLASTTKDEQQSASFARAAFFLSSIGFLASLAMAGIATFLIGAYCLYCSGLYAVSFLVLFVSIRALSEEDSLLSAFLTGAKHTIWFLSFGLLGSSAEEPRHARIGMLLSLTIAVASLQLPELIVRHYYTTQQASDIPREVRETIIAAWLAQEPKTALQEMERGGIGSLGPADAAIHIVEFSDFECPYCRQASYVLKDVMADYPGKTLLTFKQFPLDPACNRLMEHALHPAACHAARVTICAGRLSPELFWAAHDGIFSLEELSTAALDNVGQELGIADESDFRACMEDTDSIDAVKQDIELGISVRVQSTPSIYINGKKLPKNDEIHLRVIIEHLLRSA